MNIVQLHDRVNFWLDTVASPRFEPDDIDQALNAAIAKKVRESYDQNRPINRSDAIQRVQRLRDDMMDLIQELNPDNGDIAIIVAHSGEPAFIERAKKNNELYYLAEDFGYLLSFSVHFMNHGWEIAWPLTYNRKNLIERNPFRRLRKVPDVKVYYIERDGGWEIHHDLTVDGDRIDNAEIMYLQHHPQVFFGNTKDDSYVAPADNIAVIATMDTIYMGYSYKS